MPNASQKTQTPIQSLPVYAANGFCVTDGANFGDPLADADDLMLDDTYTLNNKAQQIRLTFAQTDDHSGTKSGGSPFVIAKGTETGTVGNPLHLDCAITLMGPDGVTFDAVVLVEVDPVEGAIEDIYMLALAPLDPACDYRLVGINRSAARARMAEMACVSFTRGTRITMAKGEQRPIEKLKVGDKVLSRDDGPQTVRWIGRTTVRAVGDFAPIVITKGTLHNENDLTVSPNHRLFIYQRVDEVGAGRSEVLVKAKHLVNGTTVTRQRGGFVDYFQLLFDDHQIIFAEGIAAETLLLDETTTPALPDDVSGKLGVGNSLHGKRGHEEYEIGVSNDADGDMAERLRRASST